MKKIKVGRRGIQKSLAMGCLRLFSYSEEANLALPCPRRARDGKKKTDTARGGWEYNHPIRRAKTEIPDERIGVPRDLICS